MMWNFHGRWTWTPGWVGMEIGAVLGFLVTAHLVLRVNDRTDTNLGNELAFVLLGTYVGATAGLLLAKLPLVLR